MHARDAELSHFDHALDAVLLLAHVALRQGDAVGLSTFSGERRFLAARKGTQQLRRVLNAVYDLESSTRASDYLAAAEALAGAAHKPPPGGGGWEPRGQDHAGARPPAPPRRP